MTTTFHSHNGLSGAPLFAQPPRIKNQCGSSAHDQESWTDVVIRVFRGAWVATLSTLFANPSGTGRSRATYRAVSRNIAPIIRRVASAPAVAKTIAGRAVYFNRVLLSDQLLPVVDHIFHRRLADGSYWYDYVSGEWGIEGRGRSGKIRHGLELGGPLMPDASRGQTGIFVNGRELTSWESIRLRWATAVHSGRYWVDHNGNFGPEGGLAMGNIRSMANKILLAGAIS